VVTEGGRPCACGGSGCLEAYASIPALLAILAERGEAAEGLSEIRARAQAASEDVLALLSETGAIIGQVLAGAVNALNPNRLVIGGNLALVAPWMLPSLQKAITGASMRQLASPLRIELSPLGADAVPMGGVALALQRVDADLLDANPAFARASVQ
jgi:predicted NBD/HSP70 family sugar kinase